MHFISFNTRRPIYHYQPQTEQKNEEPICKVFHGIRIEHKSKKEWLLEEQLSLINQCICELEEKQQKETMQPTKSQHKYSFGFRLGAFSRTNTFLYL